MIDIVLMRRRDLWYPFSEEDRTQGLRFPENRMVRSVMTGVKKPRSYRELCAYFGSCTYIADLDLDPNKNTKRKVDHLTRIKLGFVEHIVFDEVNNQLQWIPHRLDYTNCDQPEAHAFITNALDEHAGLAGFANTEKYIKALKGLNF